MAGQIDSRVADRNGHYGHHHREPPPSNDHRAEHGNSHYRCGVARHRAIGCGTTITIGEGLDTIGIHVLSNDKGNSTENPQSLEARIYNGNGEYSLYEDKDSAQAFTHFTLHRNGDTQSMTVSVDGDYSVIPPARELTLRFPNIVIHHPADMALGLMRDAADITVLKNGAPCKAKIKAYAEVSVTICDLDPEAIYEISVTEKPLDKLTRAKRCAIGKLQSTQGHFSSRDRIMGSITRTKSLDIMVGKISLSQLDDIDKKRLTETIFDI